MAGWQEFGSLIAFGYVACTCTACAHGMVVVDSLGRCRKVASGCERTDGTREALALRANGRWACHAFDTEDIEQTETCTRQRGSYKPNLGGARARQLKKLPSKDKKEKYGKRKDVIWQLCGKKKQRKKLC